jgi:hypothetical protein
MSMRVRQKSHRKLYPHWGSKQESPAKRAKERDGNQCVRCHVADRTLILDEQGQPRYILYLHAAHLSPLDPEYWRVEPIEGQRLRAMCPSCHRLYDLHWQEREQVTEHQRGLHAILRHRWILNRFLQVL